MRFGESLPNAFGAGEMTLWFHPLCAAYKLPDAVLEALLQDNNPGVRTQAISLLQSVKNDSSVRQAFASLALKDKDKYIQEESKRVLANLPDFE